ncbi:MAG: hypothetical protein FJ303_13940 [Planctomycetes bacterium]|nr:hypothetical protein [Planctomycetota bacterium]
MAQDEDQGILLRGFLLLGGIAVLVLIVLGLLFWRNAPQPVAASEPPERHIPSYVFILPGGFPGNVSWYSVYQLGETLPSASGWEVRYNAATALARRGSDKVPWVILREMLDEKQQMRNYRARNADGNDVYDEAAARANMLSALKAIAAWHEKRKTEKKTDVPSDLRAIYPVVESLAASSYVEMKLQAEKTRATFFR